MNCCKNCRIINATRTKHSKSKGNAIWFPTPFGFLKSQDVGPMPRSEQRWNDICAEYCWIACLHELFELNVCSECSNKMFALNIRIELMLQLNACTECSNWILFISNDRLACLHWMFELNVGIACFYEMFGLNVYIEYRNWMFESNKNVQNESVINIFEYPRWKFR